MDAHGYWERVTAVFGAVEAANNALRPAVDVLNTNAGLLTDRGWRAAVLDALVALSTAAEACLTIPAPPPDQPPPYRAAFEQLQALLHELGGSLNTAAKLWHAAATSDDPSEVALALRRVTPASNDIARTVGRINDALDFCRLRLQVPDL